LDWDAYEKGQPRIIHSTISLGDLDGSTGRAVLRVFDRHREVFLLGEMTSHLMVVHQGDRWFPILPQSLIEAMEPMTPKRRRELVGDLLEPISIGVTSLGEEEVASDGKLTMRAHRRLERLLRAPRPITFSGAVGRRRYAGHLALMVSPLVINETERETYYPITVGVAFHDRRPPRLTKRKRAEFWDELIAAMDDFIVEQTVFDPTFVGTARLWCRESREARRAARTLLRIAKDPDRLDRVGRRQFEELTAELYAAMGARVRLTRPRKDGGRDLIVEQSTPTPFRAIVECKRPERGNKIGVKPVRELLGILSEERPSKGVLVTSTEFTAGARTYEHNKWHLELVGRRRLLSMIRRYEPLAE
jgi:HJR/Mrr/RecB family endonuclease